MPWQSLHRVGMLHANTWRNTFHDMSYWQLSLHDTALTSALIFIFHYESVDKCEADVTPFEGIEILLGVQRLTKLAYDDALALADILTDSGSAETMNTMSQVAVVPFCDDPLTQKNALDQTTFVDLSQTGSGNGGCTVRLLQPSRLAKHTMTHVKVYAVRLATLGWSSTTNHLNTYQVQHREKVDTVTP